MTAPGYITNPIRVTQLGTQSLRARLSLHETQAEFANRFLVNRFTIGRWETGGTARCAKIHQAILDKLIRRLADEGHLIPEEQVLVLFREAIERRGNLDA
jgi:DNA-binding XRE family transcriptional regulator